MRVCVQTEKKKSKYGIEYSLASASDGPYRPPLLLSIDETDRLTPDRFTDPSPQIQLVLVVVITAYISADK